MTSPSSALITMKGIKKVFYTDDMETHALSEIDFEIKKGEYVAVVGGTVVRRRVAHGAAEACAVSRWPRYQGARPRALHLIVTNRRIQST